MFQENNVLWQLLNNK